MDGEYVDLHKRIQDEARKHAGEVIGLDVPTLKKVSAPAMDEFQQIMQAITYLMDRVSTLERYIRSSEFRVGGRSFDHMKKAEKAQPEKPIEITHQNLELE
jgi:hypothetical protein